MRRSRSLWFRLRRKARRNRRCTEVRSVDAQVSPDHVRAPAGNGRWAVGDEGDQVVARGWSTLPVVAVAVPAAEVGRLLLKKRVAGSGTKPTSKFSQGWRRKSSSSIWQRRPPRCGGICEGAGPAVERPGQRCRPRKNRRADQTPSSLNEAAQARSKSLSTIPGTNPDWGVNRLAKGSTCTRLQT